MAQNFLVVQHFGLVRLRSCFNGSMKHLSMMKNRHISADIMIPIFQDQIWNLIWRDAIRYKTIQRGNCEPQIQLLMEVSPCNFETPPSWLNLDLCLAFDIDNNTRVFSRTRNKDVLPLRLIPDWFKCVPHRVFFSFSLLSHCPMMTHKKWWNS